jgi:hypothetical protein
MLKLIMLNIFISLVKNAGRFEIEKKPKEKVIKLKFDFFLNNSAFQQNSINLKCPFREKFCKDKINLHAFELFLEVENNNGELSASESILQDKASFALIRYICFNKISQKYILKDEKRKKNYNDKPSTSVLDFKYINIKNCRVEGSLNQGEDVLIHNLILTVSENDHFNKINELDNASITFDEDEQRLLELKEKIYIKENIRKQKAVLDNS